MSRIKLELPEKMCFETELPIRVSDLNYGGHVGNDRMLTLMQEARVMFYRSLGFKDEVNLDGSIGQIVADAVVVYKAESFLGDILTVAIYLDDLNRFGFDMLYLVRNKLDGKEIARGKTGIVCFDYINRRVAPVPLTLRDAFTSINGVPFV